MGRDDDVPGEVLATEQAAPAPTAPEPPRDTRCRSCDQDVYLVFHLAEEEGGRVEATCYNPQCVAARAAEDRPGHVEP